MERDAVSLKWLLGKWLRWGLEPFLTRLPEIVLQTAGWVGAIADRGLRLVFARWSCAGQRRASSARRPNRRDVLS